MQLRMIVIEVSFGVFECNGKDICGHRRCGVVGSGEGNKDLSFSILCILLFFKLSFYPLAGPRLTDFGVAEQS